MEENRAGHGPGECLNQGRETGYQKAMVQAIA